HRSLSLRDLCPRVLRWALLRELIFDVVDALLELVDAELVFDLRGALLHRVGVNELPRDPVAPAVARLRARARAGGSQEHEADRENQGETHGSLPPRAPSLSARGARG